MTTFTLTSNNQFIRTFRNSPDICVFDCQDDLASFDTILSIPSHWTFCARIGDSAQYTALELFGTTIHGNQLSHLASDLTFKSNSHTFYLIVNREGLCFLSVGDPVVKRVRVNDYFGWSKYGVSCPPNCTVWSKFDMFERRIIVDYEGMKNALSESRAREAEISEHLVSKSEELGIYKSKLVEHEKELAGLKEKIMKTDDDHQVEYWEKKGIKDEAAAVAESGKEEEERMRWKKVAEEKEEELRKVKMELVARMKHSESLKGVVNSLISSMWDLNKVLKQEIVCYRLLSGGQMGRDEEHSVTDQYRGSNSEQLAEMEGDQSSHAPKK
ncbi:hypothetical protein LINPERHAP2_LOCUS33506 [Linum perenne]